MEQIKQAVEAPLETPVRHQAVAATWSLELTCLCPACNEYVDLLKDADFRDGKQSMTACEHSTPRTTGMEVNCPKCGAEFTVDCCY